MKPLHIAIACFPTLGGSGIVASEVGARLAARGHAVRFFSAEPPARLDLATPGISLARIASEPPAPDGEAYLLELANQLASASDLDVIHAHYAIPHALGALLARALLEQRGRRAPRIVSTLHGTDVTASVEAVQQERLRQVVSESDALSVPSQFLRAATLARLAPHERERAIEVIPNFVDPDAFCPQAGDLRELFPRLSGWDDSEQRPRVLFHGSNFRAWKRVADAVHALDAIVERREAALVLLGDGPERPQVEALVTALGLQDRVRLLGRQRHFADLLARADLFLLPSDTESFGLAALEALASGVPVIASAVGGIPEVVRDGETGLLVPVADPDAIATAAMRLFEDEPWRQAMGLAARADALARFAPDPAIDRYERLLRG